MIDFTLVGCIGIAAMMIAFLLGMEMWFGMTLVGFVGFAYLRSWDAALDMLAKDFFESWASYAFTVIPMFVLMGQVAFNSGMAEKMYKTARTFLGHRSGGLAMGTVVGATIFKAISGSSLATCATFSSVAIPEMDKYGYSRTLSTGVVSSCGTLGILLPPSAALIIMGMQTQQSIGVLFLAGVVPGLIAAALFFLVVLGWCRIDPAIAPKSPMSTWKERWQTVPSVTWPIIVFCVVIGGLLAGFFTPTEAGAMGALAVAVITMLKRDLDRKGFLKSIVESLRVGVMVLALLAGSTVLGHFIAITRIPSSLAVWAAALTVHPNVIMGMVMLIFLVGGSVMDDAAFSILAIPIFYPVMVELGFDPVWFCIMIGVTLMIGAIIPPVAVAVFIVKNITKESIWTVYKGCAPFTVALFAVAALLFAFPSLATWLPSVLMD